MRIEPVPSVGVCPPTAGTNANVNRSLLQRLIVALVGSCVVAAVVLRITDAGYWLVPAIVALVGVLALSSLSPVKDDDRPSGYSGSSGDGSGFFTGGS
jgi:hypothetical protein